MERKRSIKGQLPKIFNFREKGVIRLQQAAKDRYLKLIRNLELSRIQLAREKFQDSGQFLGAYDDQTETIAEDEAIKVTLEKLYFEVLSPAVKVEYQLREQIQLMDEKIAGIKKIY